jgi:hypothetical protein
MELVHAAPGFDELGIGVGGGEDGSGEKQSQKNKWGPRLRGDDRIKQLCLF